MRKTSSPPPRPTCRLGLREVARALGLQVRDFDRRVGGPLVQCPACLTKPRRLAKLGWSCTPNVELSAVITERMESPDEWACLGCMYGHDVAEFVAFALIGQRYHLLTRRQQRVVSEWIGALERVEEVARPHFVGVPSLAMP